MSMRNLSTEDLLSRLDDIMILAKEIERVSRPVPEKEPLK